MCLTGCSSHPLPKAPACARHAGPRAPDRWGAPVARRRSSTLPAPWALALPSIPRIALAVPHEGRHQDVPQRRGGGLGGGGRPGAGKQGVIAGVGVRGWGRGCQARFPSHATVWASSRAGASRPPRHVLRLAGAKPPGTKLQTGPSRPATLRAQPAPDQGPWCASPARGLMHRPARRARPAGGC